MNMIDDNALLAICRHAEITRAAAARRRLPWMNRTECARRFNVGITIAAAAEIAAVCWLIAERI